MLMDRDAQGPRPSGYSWLLLSRLPVQAVKFPHAPKSNHLKESSMAMNRTGTANTTCLTLVAELPDLASKNTGHRGTYTEK